MKTAKVIRSKKSSGSKWQPSGHTPPSPVTIIRPDGRELVVSGHREIFNTVYPKYRDYLKSDWWKKKIHRLYRKTKMPQQCAKCGNPKYQLHHITYRRVGHERMEDFLALCGGCHNELHRQFKLIKKPQSLAEFSRSFVRGR